MSSKFSLSHKKLLSLDLGELVPIGLFEVLPGDVIQQATSALVRCSPLLAPVMHPVNVRIHHFFVPYRLIWDDFEDFITGGPDGNDASVYPTRLGGVVTGSLSDYFGIPPGIDSNTPRSALPFRAYQMIWNEFYRDQDLQTEAAISTASGPDVTTSGALQNIGWEKDYFTSARPWEQKGDAITLPLGTTAPVITNNTPPTFEQVTNATEANLWGTAGISEPRRSVGGVVTNWPVSDEVIFGSQSGLVADLSTASAVTINTLREALALQRFAEARARFGSRYTEYCRYLGVAPEDSRLQRPEYLGGGSNTIQFSEVLQTAPSAIAGAENVGEMRGHGIGAMRSNRYRRYIPEHGLIMSLMSIRPKTIYMQGMSRMWNRRTRHDFWQKELQHIGQQEVLNKEVYALHSSPDGVFGYQDRYDEYRRIESGVAGEFRTTALNHWHMAREFSSEPALNADFVKCVPTERTFAVPSEDVIYAMCNHSIQARRLVAASGTSFTL